MTRLLLLGLVAWTAIGLGGTVLSASRGERRAARRGVLSIIVVWAVYLGVLLIVSWLQPVRVLAPGQEVCFSDMCFAIQGAEELEGFWARGQERARLVRVSIRIADRGRGRPQGDARLRAYLLDGRGRRWDEVKGLSGVPLTARVAAGQQAVSEPVFRVGRDATGLRLVLTHGRWQPGVLVIGDPDSWAHRPTEMPLTDHPGPGR